MELVSRVRISVVNSDALLNSDEEPSSTKIAPINEWRPPISIRVLKIRYLCQRKLRIRGYEVNRIKFADNSWDIIEETKIDPRSRAESLTPERLRRLSNLLYNKLHLTPNCNRGNS